MFLKFKFIWCCSAILLSMQMLCASPLHADDTLFFDLNFDDQVAGMDCVNLKHSWGTQGDNLMIIDNLKTYTYLGNAMLMERPEGYKAGGWGAGLDLPQKQYDWLQVQIAFLFDGSATKATCSLELREHAAKQLYYASLGSNRGKDPITLIDGGTGWRTTSVNSFDRKVWNRVTWLVPSTTASDLTMYLRLETWNATEKTWQQVGQVGSRQAAKVEKPFDLFRINFPSGEEAIKLRFDDLKIQPVTNEAISSLIK